MGREHAPKGQIVLKKAEKLGAVEAALPPESSPEDLAAKFQEMYPEDWQNIVRRHKAHERRTPPGKAHPMPDPKKYLLNMVKNFIKAKNLK